MAEPHEDYTTSIDRGWSRIDVGRTINGHYWFRGHVATPDGIVEIPWSEPAGTLMRMVVDGQVYCREWRRRFQPRYLITLAKRFAADVATGDAA